MIRITVSDFDICSLGLGLVIDTKTFSVSVSGRFGFLYKKYLTSFGRLWRPWETIITPLQLNRA